MTLTAKDIDDAATNLRALADLLTNHATELATPSEALTAGQVSAEATRWILGQSGSLDDSWQQVDALRVAAEEMTDRLVAARRLAVARAHTPAPEEAS